MARSQFRDFVGTTGYGHGAQDIAIVAIASLGGLHPQPVARGLETSARFAAVFYLGVGAWCMLALFAAPFTGLL